MVDVDFYEFITIMRYCAVSNCTQRETEFVLRYFVIKQNLREISEARKEFSNLDPRLVSTMELDCQQLSYESIRTNIKSAIKKMRKCHARLPCNI